MDHCGVLNCNNTSAADVTFYKFPKDPKLAVQWLKVTRNSLLEKNSAKLEDTKICSDHFDHLQFTNIEKRQLKWNAVPTIFNTRLDAPGSNSASSLERELINPLKLTLRELRDAPGKTPMPWEAIGTVNAINTIDKLYDSFYRVPKLRENKKINSLVTETSNHAIIWAEALDFISDWKFFDPNSFKVVHTIAQDGWINNIESCMMLRDILKNENFKKFSVRRLNLDPMRKLFRALSHSRKGTTCTQFLSDLKTYLLYESLLKSKHKIKGENSEDSLLVDFRADCLLDEKDDGLKLLESKCSDIPDLDTLWAWEEPQLAYFEAQSVLWVSAFVSKLALEKVTCVKCHRCLVSDSETSEHFVIEEKSTHLMNPSEKLCLLTGSLIKFCDRILPNVVYEKGMVAKLTKVSSEWLEVQWLKSCEAHSDMMTKYILDLLIRIIIHQYCKKYNWGS